MGKIRIMTKAGKMIERRAALTDWIDGNGIQSTTAQVGIHLYKVVGRDSYGAIFAVA